MCIYTPLLFLFHCLIHHFFHHIHIKWMLKCFKCNQKVFPKTYPLFIYPSIFLMAFSQYSALSIIPKCSKQIFSLVDIFNNIKSGYIIPYPLILTGYSYRYGIPILYNLSAIIFSVLERTLSPFSVRTTGAFFSNPFFAKYKIRM